MYLSAYVRNKETKQYTVIVHEDYKTKDSFKRDLISNDYTVIRISNKRDLATQDTGDFASFAELKKTYADFIKKDPELWSDKKELIENIQNIEL